MPEILGPRGSARCAMAQFVCWRARLPRRWKGDRPCDNVARSYGLTTNSAAGRGAGFCWSHRELFRQRRLVTARHPPKPGPSRQGQAAEKTTLRRDTTKTGRMRERRVMSWRFAKEKEGPTVRTLRVFTTRCRVASPYADVKLTNLKVSPCQLDNSMSLSATGRFRTDRRTVCSSAECRRAQGVTYGAALRYSASRGGVS